MQAARQNCPVGFNHKSVVFCGTESGVRRGKLGVTHAQLRCRLIRLVNLCSYVMTT